MTLRQKALTGSAWAAASQFSKLFLQFFVGIALARLLEPSEYGLIALGSVFLSILHTFAEGGLGMAIIQRKNLTDDDCSTVFWFNILASIPIVTATWFLAPLVSAFYREPELTPVFRIMGLGLLLGIVSDVQRVRLERTMNFKKLTLIQLPAFLVGAAVGILMAWRGFGVWSLVAMGLSSSLLSSIVIWVSSEWRPRFVFRKNSFREMFGFGIKSALDRAFTTVFQNLLTIVIGRSFSATEVGYYNRARHYQQLPAQSIYSTLLRVMLPMMSSVQDDKTRLRIVFTHSIRVAAIVSFPVFSGLLAVAEPLVLLMIGAKWLPCVPYLKVLCLSAMLLPVQAINVNCILANGLSGLSLKLSFIKQGLQLLVILATYRYGVMAMLWALVVLSGISFFINAWPNRKLAKTSITEQLGIVTPYLLLSLLMAAAVMLAMPHFGHHPLVQVLAGTTVGALIYLAGLKLLRIPAHREIADFAQKLPFVGKALRFVLG